MTTELAELAAQLRAVRVSDRGAGLLYRDIPNSDEWAERVMQAANDVRVVNEAADALAALTPGAGYAAKERYRHKARGTEYDLVGTAELQDAKGGGVEEGALLAIYRGDDGRLWARRHKEFGDGRFERISLPQPAPAEDALRDLEACERAINRMGWNEIRAFMGEPGQSPSEDAGGYLLRKIKTLFGVKPDALETYREATTRLVTEAGQALTGTKGDGG